MGKKNECANQPQDRMGAITTSATMQIRLQACKSCKEYVTCKTANQIAKPDLSCPLPEPKWTAEKNTFLDQLSSFGQSVVNWTASGLPTTPPEILAARETTCRACAEWDAAALNSTGRCRICKCSTWAKLRMATERCPLGKWEAVPLPVAPPRF